MVLPSSDDATHNPETGVPIDTLKEVARASVAVPEGFVSPFLNLSGSATPSKLRSM